MNITRIFSFCVLSLLLTSVVSAADLQKGFQTPPDSIKPSIYWYWINDNVSAESVVKDLESMHEIGLGRAFIGNIGEQTGDFGTVKIFSDQWWEATHAALKTATRLGMDIGMFNSPGWSQSGGPWIKPEKSMRYLAFSETTVQGPKAFEGKLEAPGADFQDVKVLAFKVPENKKTKLNFSLEKKGGTLDAQLNSEQTIRCLIITTKNESATNVEILAKIDDKFQSVKSFRFDRSNATLNVGFTPFAPVVISIPATTAKEFQLKFTEVRNATDLEVEFCTAPGVESVAEKTLAKMWPTPLPMWDAYMWPEQPKLDDDAFAVKPSDVLDITKSMSADGTLKWDVPEGNWVIQWAGMLTTGVENSPATKEGKGLEVDKMSKEHVAFHVEEFLGKVIERIPAADRKSLKVAVQDSYETGGQNWTDDFIKEFQKVYGYDPTPYIPVMNGVVVGSPDISDRFLWDLRRIIADKVAYDYVGGLRDAVHKHGMTTWLECYGHWGFPGEFLQYGGQSDGIAGEFWNEGDLGSIENRAASSCGHIYGKTKISAESFTAGGGVYERYPRLLKKRCDWSYTEGINDSLLHLYIHQAYEDKTPGINAWFATEFNRKNTWFYQMKPFVQYMRRCMFMLQQGQNVADVAYFIGEDAPKMTGVCDPPLPKGYSFDYINGEVIRDSLSVKDGKLVLPHGTTYRVLVLPNQKTMRPETLKKIKQLVEAGAVVLGPKPESSPSLQNYPQCDDDVRKLANELWGDVDGQTKKTRTVGQGAIFSGVGVQEALDLRRVPTDCLMDHKDTLYVHRTLEDGTEVYFITNQLDTPITFNATFRVDAKRPELWDAVDGSIREVPMYDLKDGLTLVPMKLDAWGSAFVVFRNKLAIKDGNPVKRPFTSTEQALEANYPKYKTVSTINEPWTVKFESDEIKRGPKDTRVFETLIDWTTSQNDAIKYYSGKCVYRTKFKLDEISSNEKLFVNLGRVEVIATVKVNGEEVGTLWTAPWQLDISDFVKEGENYLEVEVANTWVNRLVGDAKLPENERKTWITTTTAFKADSPLKPSGLIGPVTILSTER